MSGKYKKNKDIPKKSTYNTSSEDDDLSSFRENLNKDEIMEYKRLAQEKFRLMEKRKKAALKIQKFWRGYIARKKFKKIKAKLIKELKEKRIAKQKKEYINKNAEKIIAGAIYRYILRKRKKERQMMKKFVKLCATMIQKHIRGYLARKLYASMKASLEKLRKLILPYIRGYKTRKIFNITKIKNAIGEIKNLTDSVQTIENHKKRAVQMANIRRKKNQLLESVNNLYDTGEWVNQTTPITLSRKSSIDDQSNNQKKSGDISLNNDNNNVENNNNDDNNNDNNNNENNDSNNEDESFEKRFRAYGSGSFNNRNDENDENDEDVKYSKNSSPQSDIKIHNKDYSTNKKNNNDKEYGFYNNSNKNDYDNEYNTNKKTKTSIVNKDQSKRDNYYYNDDEENFTKQNKNKKFEESVYDTKAKRFEEPVYDTKTKRIEEPMNDTKAKHREVLSPYFKNQKNMYDVEEEEENFVVTNEKPKNSTKTKVKEKDSGSKLDESLNSGSKIQENDYSSRKNKHDEIPIRSKKRAYVKNTNKQENNEEENAWEKRENMPVAGKNIDFNTIALLEQYKNEDEKVDDNEPKPIVEKKKPFLKKKVKYDPRKAIEEAKVKAELKAQEVQSEAKKTEETNASNTTKDDIITEKTKISTPPKHEIDGEKKMSIDEELISSNTQEIPKNTNFLKRKSKKVEFNKIKWEGKSRIDCWNRKDSPEEKKLNIITKNNQIPNRNKNTNIGNDPKSLKNSANLTSTTGSSKNSGIQTTPRGMEGLQNNNTKSHQQMNIQHHNPQAVQLDELEKAFLLNFSTKYSNIIGKFYAENSIRDPKFKQKTKIAILKLDSKFMQGFKLEEYRTILSQLEEKYEALQSSN